MLVSLAVFSQAKDVRKVVDIRPDQFTVANEAFKPYLSQIIENISTNLKLTKRVKVKVAGNEATAVEANKANIDWSDPSTWVDATKAAGADYSLNGKVSSIKFQQIGGQGYKAKIEFTVNILDNKTTESIALMDFTSGGADAEIAKSSAFPAALKTTSESQQDFFKSTFNLRSTILKIDNESKSGAKLLTITAGENAGITKKTMLVVKYIEVIDGFEDESVIATLRPKEINSRTTKCTVSKGGKEISNLFDPNNREKLIVEIKNK